MLKNGIKYSYSKEQPIDGITLGIPMISFCDIPISQSQEHSEKYGSYALGLSKQPVFKKGKFCKAAPVAYLETMEPREEDIKRLFENEPTNMIFGFIKRMKYTYKDKEYNAYDECEWRLVLPSEEPNKWFVNEEEYDKWKAGRKSTFADNAVLLFNPDDIEYIIVNQKNNIPNNVKRLKKIKKIGNVDMTEEKMSLLISKVLSFEQIKKDF